MSIMLSPHFSLSEMTVTSHRDLANVPDDAAKFHLVSLANGYLEPIRSMFGPLRVTSGYRSREVNAATKGSAKDSAHIYGCAVDVQSIEGHDPSEMVRWVAFVSGLDFDQVIDEFRGPSRWMHIGILRPGHEHAPRHESLVNHDGDWSVFI